MKTVLVVDDSSFDRTYMKGHLQKLGLNTLEAGSGEEALKMCQQSMPDGIILDWEMKNMTGIELLKKLRAIEGGGEVFVLMSTSNNHVSHVGHAHVMGATDYMVKPVTQRVLREKLVHGGLLAPYAVINE